MLFGCKNYVPSWQEFACDIICEYIKQKQCSIKIKTLINSAKNTSNFESITRKLFGEQIRIVLENSSLIQSEFFETVEI